MKATDRLFLMTVVVLLLHLLRNVSFLLYVVILLLCYSLLYIQHFLFGRGTALAPWSQAGLKRWPFIISLVWLPVVSLVNMGTDSYFVPLGRYFVTFPFILFCCLFMNFTLTLVRKVLRVVAVFLALASISIPYQIAFGRIPFLASSSFREGLVRFPSLAGSLTALGTLGAFSLGFLLFSDEWLFTKQTGVILIVLTTFGMLVSLQKSAVMNLIICCIVYVMQNGKHIFFRAPLAFAVVCLLVLGAYLIFGQATYAPYIVNTIEYAMSGTSQDFFHRLWELPSAVSHYHRMSTIQYLFGIGFPALSGTLGLHELPMAHNSYFDLLYSGGVLHLAGFLILVLRIPLQVLRKRLIGKKLTYIDRCYSFTIFLLLVNMFIGGGSFYQPITCVIVFVTVCSYDRVSYELESTAYA